MRTVGFVAVLTLLVAAVLGGTFFLANNYLASRKDKKDVAACKETGAKHVVNFKTTEATPKEIKAKLCDTLTITNAGDRIRRIAFGQHNDHRAYDDVLEQYLQKGESLRVTLNEKGDFLVHDHLQEEVGSTFRVE
jgi:hypothetical protein